MLPWAEFWYNTTYHATIKMTPFQALCKRPPPAISYYHSGMTKVNEVDQQLLGRNELLQLKVNLHAGQNSMQHYVNTKRRHLEFQEGDWVLLKVQPYRQQTVFHRALQKLACRYYGPYQVEQHISPVAYKLKLLAEARIHPVFHVSLLKKPIGESVFTTKDLPTITKEGIVLLHPQQILNTHWLKKSGKFVE